MKLPARIALFVIANVLGFFSMPFCYFLGMRLGRIAIDNPNFNVQILHHLFMVGTITWFVCALFSIAFFFLKGREKYFFLVAPVLFPLLYGFKVILDLF